MVKLTINKLEKRRRIAKENAKKQCQKSAQNSAQKMPMKKVFYKKVFL